MARSSLALLAIIAPCGLAAGVQAQPMSWPPKVLYVERVEVHPGQGSAYAKAAAGLLAIFARAGSTGYCLGLSTVAGNEDDGDPFTDSQEYPSSFRIVAAARVRHGAGAIFVDVVMVAGSSTCPICVVVAPVGGRYLIANFIYPAGSPDLVHLLKRR